MRIPFTNLSREQWANLGLAALLAVSLAFLVLQLVLNRPFEYVGVDFPNIYASAKIVRDRGFAAVYDLAIQKEYQDRIYYAQFGTGYPFGVPPTPLLPVFVLLLVPLGLLEPVPSFILFTGVNAIVLAAHLWHLAQSGNRGGRLRTVVAMLLTLPAFFTLLFGQLNVWLAVCLAQAYLAFRSGKDLRAGAWLAGAALKPQILILFVPGLLVARRFRALAGVLGVVGMILIISTGLAGTTGMLALLQLLAGFAQPEGLASNAPGLMMNWRALAVNLEPLVPNASIAWIIAFAGMLLTTLPALGLWLAHANRLQPVRPPLWLGTLAATFAVTWHSHIHMALPFLSMAVLYWSEAGRLPTPVLLWLFLPPAIFLALAFVAGTAGAQSIIGLVVFALNLWVLTWACQSEARATQHGNPGFSDPMLNS